MKIDFIRVYGFEPAFHGMRNPMDSWKDSDSTFFQDGQVLWETNHFGLIRAMESPELGPKDLELACKLIRRGREHRKFLRQIMVWVQFTLPRFVYQELDTYKVGTTRNSCSTMNKLGSRDLEQHDFEKSIYPYTLEKLNELGRALREAKGAKGDVGSLRVQLKNDLPEGYLQKSMYTMSYETALTMLLQRENHRLPQWRLEDEGSICEFLKDLPYMIHFHQAATWKRSERRACVKELRGLAELAKDVPIDSAQLSILADRLVKSI